MQPTYIYGAFMLAPSVEDSGDTTASKETGKKQ